MAAEQPRQDGREKYCRECAATRVTCAWCMEEKSRALFPREMKDSEGLIRCEDCGYRPPCGGCKLRKQRREYATKELVKISQMRCNECVEKRVERECSGCHVKKIKDDYSFVQLEQGARRVCEACLRLR